MTTHTNPIDEYLAQLPRRTWNEQADATLAQLTAGRELLTDYPTAEWDYAYGQGMTPVQAVEFVRAVPALVVV